MHFDQVIRCVVFVKYKLLSEATVSLTRRQGKVKRTSGVTLTLQTILYVGIIIIIIIITITMVVVVVVIMIITMSANIVIRTRC